MAHIQAIEERFFETIELDRSLQTIQNSNEGFVGIFEGLIF